MAVIRLTGVALIVSALCVVAHAQETKPCPSGHICPVCSEENGIRTAGSRDRVSRRCRKLRLSAHRNILPPNSAAPSPPPPPPPPPQSWGMWRCQVLRIARRRRRRRYFSPSGGGYGNPLDRPAEQVLEDVLDDFITAQHAEEAYSVVLKPADNGFPWELDAVATAALRASRRG